MKPDAYTKRVAARERRRRAHVLRGLFALHAARDLSDDWSIAEVDELATDLLTDLMHRIGSRRFAKVLASAELHYTAEKG